MLKNRFSQGLALICIAIVFASCATTSTATQSPPTAPGVSSASSKPKIVDIVGISEWKPMQESSLICAAEGDESTYTYLWTASNGTIKGSGKEVTWTAPDAPGDYTVTVAVSNSRGEGETYTRSFKVTTNPYNNESPDQTIYLKFSLPSASIISESRHPRIWTTSEIECVVEGKDPAELTYQWAAPTGKLNGNGLAEGKASRVGWIAPGVAGLYKVTVKVTDKYGNTANGEVNFDVFCCKE